MWLEIEEKIAELAAFDKTRQVFGARNHGYRKGSTLSEVELAHWEGKYGIQLPAELRAYYLECGNGGAGPYYGMKPLENIELFKADAPFLTASELRLVAKQNFDPADHDCEFYYEGENCWSVPMSAYQGMVSIIEYGCGEQICSVLNGPNADLVVMKTLDDGLHEMGSLRAEFHRWLDEELSRFRFVIELLETCASAAELDQACVEDRKFYGGRDYMVSYLGAEKPAELFGANENRFHGAVQFPWYEKQFPKKRKFWSF